MGTSVSLSEDNADRERIRGGGAEWRLSSRKGEAFPLSNPVPRVLLNVGCASMPLPQLKGHLMARVDQVSIFRFNSLRGTQGSSVADDVPVCSSTGLDCIRLEKKQVNTACARAQSTAWHAPRCGLVMSYL